MKKIIAIITCFVILAIASVTAFVIVKNKEDNKQNETNKTLNDYVLFSFDSESITGVDIDCPDGTYNVELIDGYWKLTNTDEFIVNQDYIANINTYMCSLTANKSFGNKNDVDLSIYGLSDPRIITCRNDTETFTIYVGDTTPTKEAFYCLIEGRDTIYSIEALYGSVLYANKDFIKSANMIQYTENEIIEFELIRDDKTIYRAVRNDDNIWQLAGEHSNLKTDSTSINAMINVFTRLKAEEFIEENLSDYSKYNFDNPTAKMIISGRDGKSYSYLFSDYGHDVDNNYTYILDETSKQVFTLYTYDVNYINYEIVDVVVNTIYSTDISTITGLDIVYNDKQIKLDIDSRNMAYSLNGKDITACGEEALSNLENMYMSLSNLPFSAVDNDAVVTGEPTITVTYHLIDGNKTTMEFIPIDDVSYWLKINDTYTGFIIRESHITGTTAFMYWYDKLATVVSESNV